MSKKLFRKLALLILLPMMVIFPVVAQAVKQEMKCGDPTRHLKEFKFTLEAPDGSQETFKTPTYGDNAIKKSDDSEEKAEKIRNIVKEHKEWDAVLNGDKLTFKHRYENDDNPKWEDVAKITINKDGTGETIKWTALEASAAIFDFGLSDSVASGFDEDGGQSFVTVSTSIGDATVFLDSGYSAVSIIDSLFLDLQGDGVDISRLSPLRFRIIDDTSNAYILFQVTDTDLDVVGASATALSEIPTLTEWGLIIFGVVLVGFITYVFLRRRRAVVSLR